jgi:hypothetical protein
MSVGGTGIPRLQDLSYIEVAVGQVEAGATFGQIRRSLVARAMDVARESDVDGSFDERHWETLSANESKHVHNTVDVLKELMRLGWLDRHILPSGPSSAYLHTDARFNLTHAGLLWAQKVVDDRRAAYNELIGVLIEAHPQFEGYLRAVGARPDSTTTHISIPLLRWDSVKHRSEAEYLEAHIAYVTGAVRAGTLGWAADADVIDAGIRSYVGRIKARLKAREKVSTRKQFVGTCEEAVTRVAFAAVGCPLDYISMELLRRWTRFLGITNFSYYAPGATALRLWATAQVVGRGSGTKTQRRVGSTVRRESLDALWRAWQDRRSESASVMYLPYWELRAAVCWHQRINDEEFDKAVVEALNGVYPNLPFAIHLDQASLGPAPASTRPLILPTASGLRRVFNVVSVMPISRKEN